MMTVIQPSRKQRSIAWCTPEYPRWLDVDGPRQVPGQATTGRGGRRRRKLERAQWKTMAAMWHQMNTRRRTS